MDDLADLTTTWHLHPTTTATCDDGSLCSELDKLMGARTNTHYLLGTIYMSYMKLPASTASPESQYRLSGSCRYSAGVSRYMYAHALPGTRKMGYTDRGIWITG